MKRLASLSFLLALAFGTLLPLSGRAYAYSFMVNPRCVYRDLRGVCQQYDYSSYSPSTYGTSTYNSNYGPSSYSSYYDEYPYTSPYATTNYTNRYNKYDRLYQHNYRYGGGCMYNDDLYCNHGSYDRYNDYYDYYDNDGNYRRGSYDPYENGSSYDPYNYGSQYGNETYEYEHTRIYCGNRDCTSSYYRY